MSIQASVVGNLTLTDTLSSTIALSRQINWSAIFSVNELAVGGSVGVTPTSVTLPGSPTQFVYIKNTHASQLLTVAWTPNGGASSTVAVLAPSGVLVLVEPSAVTGGGITTLTVTGSAASTTYEYLFVA